MNRLDAVVVAATVPGLFAHTNNAVLNALSVLRVLRPMRLFRFLPGLRAILLSLTWARHSLLAVFTMLMFSFVVLGVVAQGRFLDSLDSRCVVATCTSADCASPPNCSPTSCSQQALMPYGYNASSVTMLPEMVCGVYECPSGFRCDTTFGGFHHGHASFDHFGRTILVLLQMCTLSDWQLYAHSMRLHLGDFTLIYSFFIILYMAFFALNLFAGVVVFTFRQIKQNYAFSGFESNPWEFESQSTAVRNRYGSKEKTVSLVDLFEAQKRANKLYEAFKSFEESNFFNGLVYLAILVNAFFSASASVGMSQNWIDMLKMTESIFVWFFVVEAGIRIMSQGHSYFTNPWNIFDFTIALVSMLSVIMDDVGVNISPLRTLRLFRALRLLRIFRRFDSFRVIVDSAFASYKVMMNMFIFFFFGVLVFSLLMMELLGNKMKSPDTGLPPRSNFDSFYRAFLSTMQIMTGDRWHTILFDAMSISPAYQIIAPVIFVIVLILGVWLCNALFLAALMENIDLQKASSNRLRRKKANERVAARRKRQHELEGLMHISDEEKPILQRLLGRHYNSPLSCFVFGPEDGCRVACQQLVLNRYFRGTLGFLVITATLVGVIERELNQEAKKDSRVKAGYDSAPLDSTWNYAFVTLDLINVVIFTAEAIMKCIAFGCISTAQQWTERWPNADASGYTKEEEALMAEEAEAAAAGISVERLRGWQSQALEREEDIAESILFPEPPAEEIALLEEAPQDADVRASFDEIYGKGAAERIVGPLIQEEDAVASIDALTSAEDHATQHSAMASEESQELEELGELLPRTTAQKELEVTVEPTGDATTAQPGSGQGSGGTEIATQGTGTEVEMRTVEEGLKRDNMPGSEDGAEANVAASKELGERINLDISGAEALTAESSDEPYNSAMAEQEEGAEVGTHKIHGEPSDLLAVKEDYNVMTPDEILALSKQAPSPRDDGHEQAYKEVEDDTYSDIKLPGSVRIKRTDETDHIPKENEVPYLQYIWNWMDLGILVASYYSYAYSISHDGSLLNTGGEWAGLGQALRFLRVINLSTKLKRAIEVIRIALKPAVQVLAMILGTNVIFAIAGLNLFLELSTGNSKLGLCNDATTKYRDCANYMDPAVLGSATTCALACTGTYTLSSGRVAHGALTAGQYIVPRVWHLPEHDFRNFVQSLWSVFVVGTLDHWTNVLYDVMGATDTWYLNSNPGPSHTYESWGNGIFVVLIVMVAHYFLVNLFVCCIICCFDTTRGSDGDSQMENMRRMVQFNVPQQPPPRPDEPGLSQTLYDVVMDTIDLEWGPVLVNWSVFMMVVTTLDVATMLSAHSGSSSSYEDTIFLLNVVFSILYSIDIGFKFVALGCVGFFWNRKDRVPDFWNNFDLLITSIGIMGLFVTGIRFLRPLRILRVFRAARATKVFRVFKGLQRVRSVVLVLWCSFQQYLWYFYLQVVLIVVFAQLGQDLFYGIKYQHFINELSNFNSFRGALSVLFYVATGAWTEVIVDCSVQPPECTQGLDCGPGPVPTTLFFGLFYFLLYMLVFKMLIGLMIENYTWVHSLAESDDEKAKDAKSTGRSTVSFDDLDQFQQVWDTFDQEQLAVVPLRHLRPMLYSLGPPLGLVPPVMKETLKTEMEIDLEAMREEKREQLLEALAWELSRAPQAEPGVIKFSDIFLLLCARVLGLSTFEDDYHNTIQSGSVGTSIARFNLAIIKGSSSKEFQAKASLRGGSGSRMLALADIERDLQAKFDLDPHQLQDEMKIIMGRVQYLKQMQAALNRPLFSAEEVHHQIGKLRHMVHKLRGHPSLESLELVQAMLADLKSQLSYEVHKEDYANVKPIQESLAESSHSSWFGSAVGGVSEDEVGKVIHEQFSPQTDAGYRSCAPPNLGTWFSLGFLTDNTVAEDGSSKAEP